MSKRRYLGRDRPGDRVFRAGTDRSEARPHFSLRTAVQIDVLRLCEVHKHPVELADA